MKLHCNQRGVSLVELMISLVLGLVILGGVTAIFIGTSATFALNRELDRSQENLRFVATLLLGEFRQATRVPETATSPPLRPIDVLPELVAADDDTTQAITIRYPVVNLGEAFHCNGDDVPGGTTLEKMFWVDNGTLRCQSGIRTGESVGWEPAQDMTFGVRRIQVVEWIASNVDPDPNDDCNVPYVLRQSLRFDEDLVANEGLGLMGVRFLVEHEHVRGESRVFVITAALRNAVLQWFTVTPGSGSCA